MADNGLEFVCDMCGERITPFEQLVQISRHFPPALTRRGNVWPQMSTTHFHAECYFPGPLLTEKKRMSTT